MDLHRIQIPPLVAAVVGVQDDVIKMEQLENGARRALRVPQFTLFMERQQPHQRHRQLFLQRDMLALAPRHHPTFGGQRHVPDVGSSEYLILSWWPVRSWPNAKTSTVPSSSAWIFVTMAGVSYDR